jgi:hypothetical protein
MPELQGQATAEQVAEWKAKHGKVMGVARNGRIAYFRELKTMDEFNAYYASMNDEKVTDAWEALTDLTFLGGCEDMLKNPQDLHAIFGQLKKEVIGQEAELVNL